MEKSKSRILIVEDEALITTHLERIVTKSGYDVLGITASGEEALQLLEEALPDLVLMDINLAGELDGIETAAQIHERFDIPIVYLTGYTEEVVVQQAKITKPFGYVAKPIRERELCATIEMALYRHRLQAQLKESEEKYRLLVEQPIAGITMIQDYRIVFANQVFAKMLGYSTEELYAMSAEEVLALGHPEDQELREQYHRDRLAGKPAPKRYASRYIRKDGAVRWMETAAHLTKYQGRPAVQAFFLDVTERKRAEEALRENETRFRALSDATFEGIAFTEQGVIVDANQQFADIFGYQVNQVQGLDVRKLVVLEEREFVWNRILTGSEEPYEHRALCKDGTVIFLEVRPRMMSIKGRPMRVTAVRDITERKQAEKKLKASLREKEVLLEEIHHRVKNNFAIIYGLLDIQADYVHDEQSRIVFRDSQHRLQTMALIHEQLYATPDLAQIDLTDYVHTLTTDLFTTYRVNLAHPVEPKLNVHDVLLEIKQAIPCGMIINELVSNALKYAFPATGDWPPDFVGEVRVIFHSTDEGKYELVVSDNGIGLPADFRLPSNDTLGLFLIDRLAQQLGGTVEWQRDGGTTCRIMFARQ